MAMDGASFNSHVTGFILALCSLLMTAIFPIFGKIKRVKSTNINPMIFNIYYEMGVIAFCIGTTIAVSLAGPVALQFSYMGLTSGLLSGMGSWFIWLSLTYMGLSHTSAVSSGVASMTGFIEGLTLGVAPQHIALSVLALLLIMLGIAGIGFNEKLTSFMMTRLLCRAPQPEPVPVVNSADQLNAVAIAKHAYPPVLFRFKSDHSYVTVDLHDDDMREDGPGHEHQHEEQRTHIGDDEAETASVTPMSDEQQQLLHASQLSLTPAPDTVALRLRCFGVLFSVVGGLCFGSMGFPEEFTKEGTTEIYFLPSFGAGVLIMLLINLAIVSTRVGGAEQEWHFKQCFLPGLVSGILWAMGFLAMLYAELLLSYGLAIPIRECSICVAVLIGVYGFKEVTHQAAILVTLLCVCVTLVGVFLLPLGIS